MTIHIKGGTQKFRQTNALCRFCSAGQVTIQASHARVTSVRMRHEGIDLRGRGFERLAAATARAGLGHAMQRMDRKTEG